MKPFRILNRRIPQAPPIIQYSKQRSNISQHGFHQEVQPASIVVFFFGSSVLNIFPITKSTDRHNLFCLGLYPCCCSASLFFAIYANYALQSVLRRYGKIRNGPTTNWAGLRVSLIQAHGSWRQSENQAVLGVPLHTPIASRLKGLRNVGL